MGIRLIGREAELGALLAALDRAQDGAGRIVLLSGEAGIGKSRLAAELVAAAATRGFTTLEGRAHPLHAGLAYAPIVEAMRPALTGRTTGLDLLLAAPRHTSVEPTLAKARMFEAVTTELSKMAPVVLFLDDLHWADLGTIELAHYLSRNSHGVLVLATCREPSGPLRDLAMAIRRVEPRDEIALSPLADPAVTELASEILGEPPSSALLRDLTKRAKGNPLFVTALTSAPINRRTIPTIVRDVVLGRLQSLSDPARRLVEAVAVAGDAGTDELLREVWHEDDFDMVIRGLVQGGLVTEHLSGRTVAYRIAHPLYAEVAYAELTTQERRRAHAALAKAIDRDRPDDVLALAPHYLGAGTLADPARTATVLADAGMRALEIHAEDEALRYLKAAIAEARDPDLLVKVLDGVGRLHQGAGRLAKASESWTKAIEVGQREGTTERLGPLGFWLALLEAERGNFVAAAHAVGVALGAGAPSDPTLAVEYTVLAMHFAVRGDDKDQLRRGSHDLIKVGGAAAHLGRATIAVLESDWETGRREAEATIVAGDQTSGRLSTMLNTIARTQLQMICILTGDLPAAQQHAEDNRDLPALYEYSMFASAAHYYVSFSMYLRGDIPAALAEIERGLALERQADRARMLSWMLMVRAWMNIELGRLTTGKADLNEAERVYGTGITDEVGLNMLHSSAVTMLTIHSGHSELAPPVPDYADALHDPIASGFWLMFAAQAAVAAGNIELAENLLERLRMAGRDAPLVDALADRIAGLLGNPALSLAAADRLQPMGALVLAAQARLEMAEQLSDPGPIQQCADVFERYEVVPWLERARGLARTLGVRLAASRKPATLSKRESEVVALVGEGLSNADIAARLFVSERTVESHLRNSYAKLGLHSRVALARWATENQQIT